jgi:hypothetical protein
LVFGRGDLARSLGSHSTGFWQPSGLHFAGRHKKSPAVCVSQMFRKRPEGRVRIELREAGIFPVFRFPNFNIGPSFTVLRDRVIQPKNHHCA